MVNQVGRPAMFDGNMFLPETGTPIWKMARMRTELAVWLPLPLTVATWMLKSLVTEWLGCSGSVSAGDTSRVDIDGGSLYRGVWPRSRFLQLYAFVGQVGNLQRVGNPQVCAGCQPARRLTTCPTATAKW